MMPPAVFQTASETGCTLPALTTPRFCHSGSDSQSLAWLSPSPLPIS